MDNQLNNSKAYIQGWEACRRYICNLYQIDEKEVIKQEEDINTFLVNK